MHVRLIDANSLGYAQHHALDVTTAGELQTQAIEGVASHLRKHLTRTPDVLNVMIWDGRAQWRYDLLPGYKSGRKRTAEQRAARYHYEAQRPWIRRVLKFFPVLQVEHPHAEADDLGWGLSQQLAKQGHLVSCQTVDADWYQMVRPRVQIAHQRKPLLIELDGFAKASGFSSPSAVPLIKALSGDNSDDIPGLPDIADKRAQLLLTKYGSIPAMFEAAGDVLAFSQEPKYAHGLMLPGMRELVERNLRMVDLSKGPALQGSDVTLDIGESADPFLWALLDELQMQPILKSFDWWVAPLQADPSLAAVQSVQRALNSLSNSWAI
jgi:DNA polymerase-1